MVGAVGAGIWAMTQEPPAQHKTQPTHRPTASVQRKPELPKTPKLAATPVPRPSHIVTSSVARPERPVPDRPDDGSLYTTTRVNMRMTANMAASIVATLNAGQAVKPILRDGKWQLVSVRGRKGWILGEYLHPAGPDAPRPRMSVPGARETSMSSKARVSEPTQKEPGSSLIYKAKALFTGGRKPLRAPQEGDCQCPYDLMISGAQCGDRSAYSRRSRKNVQCYL